MRLYAPSEDRLLRTPREKMEEEKEQTWLSMLAADHHGKRLPPAEVKTSFSIHPELPESTGGRGCEDHIKLEQSQIWPHDEHNLVLLDNVYPRKWQDPKPEPGFVYDLIAIGAGAGGLVSAKQSARRGARSALIEYHLAGGDCLNVGCVPSKALIRAARCAKEARKESKGLGINVGEVTVDFGVIMQRMRRLRAHIAPADALSTSTAVGVDCYMGRGVFTSPNTIVVNDQTLTFKTAVIATGGSAALPRIPGLAEAPYHTNASLFNLCKLPPRLIVVGGGPIGLEMAQSFALFGSQVTVTLRECPLTHPLARSPTHWLLLGDPPGSTDSPLAIVPLLALFRSRPDRLVPGSPKLLPKEDEDAALIVREQLEGDGVVFATNVQYVRVEHTAASDPEAFPEIRVVVLQDGMEKTLTCDVLLVATGRKPNVEGLGLDKAGVDFNTRDGVKVDANLRTTNKNVFAVGDVCTPFQFTHVAGAMAG